MGRPIKFDERKALEFASEYAKDWNATQACVRMGYNLESARTLGYEFKKNQIVLKQIELLFEEHIGSKRKMTADCLQLWYDIANDEDSAKKDRLKASEYIAKYAGLFVDQQEIHVTGDMNVTGAKFEFVEPKHASTGET